MATQTTKDHEKPIHERMIYFLTDLQDRIVDELKLLEPTLTPKVDEWTRGDHRGRIIVFQDGSTFEKAGVTMSIVKDKLREARRQQLNARGWKIPEGEHPYLATGLSLVFHPVNPFAPTVHLNYRYFEVNDKDSEEPLVWWFGGGSDLTPSYYFEEDAIHFHKEIKNALDKHGEQYYPKFKKWCDEYFYLPHREEHRGIGGIFFDDLTGEEHNKDGLKGGKEAVFSLVKDSANAFIPAYFPIVKKRKEIEYNENNKVWQQLRRGRYVEFNLVYDRGTHFGLKVPGIRAENILVSLPLTARWEFDHQPEEGSEEEKSLLALKKAHDWLKLENE